MQHISGKSYLVTPNFCMSMHVHCDTGIINDKTHSNDVFILGCRYIVTNARLQWKS